MSVSTKANQLTGPASTGNSSTTDPGFTPKALLMWAGLQTASGAKSQAQFSLGVAGSGSTEIEAGYNSDDVVTTSDATRNIQIANRILRLDTAGTSTENVGVNFTSFDATGFSNNFVALSTVSPLYQYLAIGGADITNVFSGSYTMAISTGNQSVTGVGFRPDVVFLFTTLATAASSANNNNQYSFGVMDSAGNQWAITQKSQNGAATSNTNRAFDTSANLILTQTAADNVAHSQSFVSMDSDGFTINITTALGTASVVGFMAIKGGQWKVGNATQKTSTGNKSTTGVGFTPRGMIFGTVCDTTTSGVSTNARLCVGASTGASNNVSLWTGDADNSALMVTDTNMSSSKCIFMGTEGVLAAVTTQAEANIDTFDSDGFTLNWTTADATSRAFGFVAFGDNAAAAKAPVYSRQRNSVLLRR